MQALCHTRAVVAMGCKFLQYLGCVPVLRTAHVSLNCFEGIMPPFSEGLLKKIMSEAWGQRN